MASREKPRESVRSGRLAPPPRHSDREVELSPTVEGRMADTTTRGRADTSGAHATYESKGASRTYDRPGRGTYIMLSAGAVVMLLVPVMILAALDRAGEGGVVLGPTTRARIAAPLQLGVGLFGVLLVWRRLRRSISPALRTAYVAAAWLLCLGASLVVTRLDPRTGDVVFDAGTLGIFALLLGDSVLRRKGRGEA